MGLCGGQAAACPRVPVSIEVRVVDPDPAVSTEARVDDLHRLMGARHAAASRHLGLTSFRVEWQGEVAAGGIAGPEGACMVPVAVTMTFTQVEHLVRIAREIPPGTCLHAEVEAHERRHVAVNRAALRAAAAEAREVAYHWARAAEGRGAVPDRAAESLRLDLRRAIEPVLARMHRAQAQGHAEIDTPAEYRRLAAACPADHALVAARLLEP